MPSQRTLTARPALQLASARHATGGTDRARISMETSAGIAVQVLGGLSVRADQKTMGPRDLGGTKLRRVLLALILNREAPVSKDRLIAMLWEGSTPPSGARATLESYVCVLRKKLQPYHDAGTSLITTVAGCYAIDMSQVELDLVRFEHLISAALQPEVSAREALPMLEQAMALVESPLLPGEIDCEWLDDVRKTHNQGVRRARIAAANKVAGLPSPSAERWARRVLEEDPLDEAAWHALLRNMEASGQHAQGLREYNRCRGVLAAELGCAPGPGLQDLYVRLLRGAHENDTELTQLFDAVTRLHAERRMSHPAPVGPGGPVGHGVPRRRPNDHTRSIEQARRSLDLLLSSVGDGSHQQPLLGRGA